MAATDDRQRITIAVLALGGEGGGVLADWILDVAATQGYRGQGTSVPGVAQRTGATVYYIELFPGQARANQEPVLALMPLPGDVDLVIASELMETGRAILRGFVSKDRTTLIGSTHRVYAIDEKTAMGDGRASGERILAAANERAKRFIGFDMDAVAKRSGSLISSVMLGALAASDALPFPRETFEEAIRSGGKAVGSNLAAFSAGYAAAIAETEAARAETVPPEPTTEAGRALLRRIRAELPEQAHGFAIEGVRRLSDYQDHAYAGLYLDRLAGIRARDDGRDGSRLTRETARHLALWMSYEDTIRVADLKVRASRFARVRDEVRAEPDQPLAIVEYMHPRIEEVCETLPAGIGGWVLARPNLTAWLRRWFSKGRRVRTSSLRWFAMLSLVAGMRRWRRGTLRYRIEQERIENWLALVRQTAETDVTAAVELVACQRLIKGYSDTFERGLGNFERIVAAWPGLAGRPDAGATVRRLREAALADDEGKALDAMFADLAAGSVNSYRQG
ncbi:indolepyruvate oxidoreductase subunit beta family protein [Sphingomonas sp. dw_22]|uniref:indolepyruvate oxidoreductase subunit beta family protein n=1 Tax=Sphingomonas sp. dw_22 TaxID=2721175 RepID=UPI001BD39472|nr:indolepyruvate oxidoreductase subunit beta family protein [Sphingomonas sp. dw_22]